MFTIFFDTYEIFMCDDSQKNATGNLILAVVTFA